MVSKNDEFERNIPDKRYLKKRVPTLRNKERNSYEEADKIWERNDKKLFKCPYCGSNMEPYRDYGFACVWRCYTPHCYNNPDYINDKNIKNYDTPLIIDEKAYSWFHTPKRLV